MVFMLETFLYLYIIVTRITAFVNGKHEAQSLSTNGTEKELFHEPAEGDEAIFADWRVYLQESFLLLDEQNRHPGIVYH